MQMKSEGTLKTEIKNEEVPSKSEDIVIKKETKKGRKSKKAKLLEQEALAQMEFHIIEEDNKSKIPSVSNVSNVSSVSRAKNKINYNLNEQIERKEKLINQLKVKRQYLKDSMSSSQLIVTKKVTLSDNEKQKTHWDFLIKEMEWMSKDFYLERKAKQNNAKKFAKGCLKIMQDKQTSYFKNEKLILQDARKNAKAISKLIQNYWLSISKIIRHNYLVQFEAKKQESREKRLKQFVEKNLKLSSKVAEELSYKTYIPQNEPSNLEINIIKADNQYSIESQPKSLKYVAEKAAEIAQSAQPTGFTLSTSAVRTKVPFLLRGTLREYQIIGLDWLVTLHNKKLNGILADEMGLGKTIQTIALIASLVVDKGIWGPHLIVVPTTIIINWEYEFKKWCPALKILTYYGSQRERKMKRCGWSRENAFNICITSYKLVIQDHFAFRRKKWYYMVLDEAQNIKNFRSQRWQTLLRFNTKRRLLLTGTPLQNDVMELWSMMHFLMPQIFASHQDFKDWFFLPFSQTLNNNASLNLSVIKNLHSILRPFLLRRLKKDVEKQLPPKIEHIVYCGLSRRQQYLYDEFINCDRTQFQLRENNFFSIMNILMQLRKVCNHPDLFETRHIDSPFAINLALEFTLPKLIYTTTFLHSQRIELLSSRNLIKYQQEEFQKKDIIRMTELMPCKSFLEAYFLLTNNLDLGIGYIPNTNKKYPSGNCLLKTQNFTNVDLCTLPQVLDVHFLPNFLSPTTIPFPSSIFELKSTSLLFNSSKKFIFEKKRNAPETSSSELKEYISRMKMMNNIDKFKQIENLETHSLYNIRTVSPIWGSDCRKKLKIRIPFLGPHISKSFYYNSFNTKNNYNETNLNIDSINLNKICKSRQLLKLMDIEEDIIPQNSYIIYESSTKIERKRLKRKHLFDEEKKTSFVIIIDKNAIKDSPQPIASLNNEKADNNNILYPNFEMLPESETMLTRNKKKCLENKLNVVEVIEINVPVLGKRELEMKIQDSIEIPEQENEKDSNSILTIGHWNSEFLRQAIKSPIERLSMLSSTLRIFKFYQPKALAKCPFMRLTKVSSIHEKEKREIELSRKKLLSHSTIKSILAQNNFLSFPDKWLVQYDSGKFHKLSELLSMLKMKNSKVLIFTQMAKMLNIIEFFLNLHSYTYVRLDGSTKIEMRQYVIDRFNFDPKIFCFISSTRCGGIGINLTAADAVIFYDNDWNPAMDKQAQDRCHRIGQTKQVHVFRLITANTIEENIFRKSLQKREIGGLVMEEGKFDTEFFKKINFKDVIKEEKLLKKVNIIEEENINIYTGPNEVNEVDKQIQSKKLEEALIEIEDVEDIQALKNAKNEEEQEFEFSENENQNEKPKENENDKKEAKEAKEAKSSNVAQNQEKKQFRKNEEINWENDESLQPITKLCLQFYKTENNFETFCQIRNQLQKTNEKHDLVGEDEIENSPSEQSSLESDVEALDLNPEEIIKSKEVFVTEKSLIRN